MENSPHMLLEGICIACYAIGAHQAWIYIRGEYDGPYQRLVEAIAELRAEGILGERPFGIGEVQHTEIHDDAIERRG